ncbi:MAG: suppressor of fused domain protein [Archangium sp.]|nr:suppressor of fused domain protein [Archangium sp.]
MVPGEQIWSELKPRFEGIEPLVFFQAQLGPDEGGPPLSRIVAFRASEPQPHWHFVTCGLSASRFIAGYPEGGGVELTFRLGRKPSEKTPPKWVAGFLQQLGRTAFSDSGRIAVAETIDLAPRLQQPETALTAGYYVADPLVPAGSIPLVQLVALTTAERGRVEAMKGRKSLELLLELAPAGISDLERARPPPPAPAAARRPTPPPPPTPSFQTLVVSKSGTRMRLAIGQGEVTALVEAISAAVRLGRVSCSSGGWTVHLNVEDIPRSASWGTTLAVYFTLDLAKQVMADLGSRPGEVLRYDGLPDFELVVGEGAQPSVLGKLARFFGAK